MLELWTQIWWSGVVKSGRFSWRYILPASELSAIHVILRIIHSHSLTDGPVGRLGIAWQNCKSSANSSSVMFSSFMIT